MPVITHGGVATNYQLVGPGLRRDVPPVALIHGLGANLAFWYLGAVRHMRERSLLLHDLRGHGASAMPPQGYRLDRLARDLLELIDALGIEKIHVVGHSHGARVALVFAQNHPERVESLTVADTQLRALQPPMRLSDWPHWPDWKAELKGRGVSDFPPEDAVIDFRLLADLGPRGGAGPQPVPRAGGGPLAKKLSQNVRPRRAGDRPGGNRIDLRSRQMGARGADQWQRLLSQTSAEAEMMDESPIHIDHMDQLTMPVLLMYGRLSHCLPTSERLEALMPDARRVLVPGAGHFFPVVKPQFFARALRMFLARVDSRAGRPVPDTTAPLVARSFGSREQAVLRRRG